jgi:DNA-binding LytR/AlgR family response regulator
VWPDLILCGEAADGRQAMELIERYRPQVAFLDIRMPIKQLAEELDPAKFWRIHRSTIVNAAGIAEVSRSMTGRGIVRLKDRPEILAVSRSYIHIFKQM